MRSFMGVWEAKDGCGWMMGSGEREGRGLVVGEGAKENGGGESWVKGFRCC